MTQLSTSSSCSNAAALTPMAGRLIRVIKPSSYSAVLRVHLLWVSILAPIFLVVRFVPVVYWLPMKICLFRNMTGYPCPFCGFTRAFVGLAHGRWSSTLIECPAVIPLFITTAGLLVWNLLGLLSGRIITLGPALHQHSRSWIFVMMGGGTMLLGNWIYRLVEGLL